MSQFRIQRVAGHRLDEIYVYSRKNWGDEQAQGYIRGMFEHFQAIASRKFPWRPVHAEFGIAGFYCRYESHFIYWKELADGTVGIVTVLHERMHQIERFREDLGAPSQERPQ